MCCCRRHQFDKRQKKNDLKDEKLNTEELKCCDCLCGCALSSQGKEKEYLGCFDTQVVVDFVLYDYSILNFSEISSTVSMIVTIGYRYRWNREIVIASEKLVKRGLNWYVVCGCLNFMKTHMHARTHWNWKRERRLFCLTPKKKSQNIVKTEEKKSHTSNQFQGPRKFFYLQTTRLSEINQRDFQKKDSSSYRYRLLV